MAAAHGALLLGIRPPEAIRVQHVSRAGPRLLLELAPLGAVAVTLPVSAPFHLRNVAVAAAAVDRLARDGWPLGAEHLRAGLAARLPGRSRPAV